MPKYLTQQEAADYLKIGLDDFLLDYYAVGKVAQYRRTGSGEIVYLQDEIDEASGKKAADEAKAALAPKPETFALHAHRNSSGSQESGAGQRDYVRKRKGTS